MRRLLRALLITLALTAAGSAAVAQACTLTALRSTQSDLVARTYRSSLVDPGPNQGRLLEAAAARMTPLLCAAVSQVAFTESDGGSDSGGLTMGWVMTNSHQSTVHVNALSDHASEADLTGARPEYRANVWLTAIETLVHEATHAAVHLLNTQLKPGVSRCLFLGYLCEDPTDPSLWSAADVELARTTTERLRLRGGFRTEWERIHQAFVEVGWARPYGSAPAVADLASSGFMSAYGATKPGEDIAEMATMPATRLLRHIEAVDLPVTRPESETGDHACAALIASGERITHETAAVFTKLSFARDAGLVSEEDFSACVGDVTVTTQAGDGFHFTVDGEHARTMDGDVTARIGLQESTNRIVFEMRAEGEASFMGETGPATIILRLDLAPGGTDIDAVSWPRGVYAFHSSASELQLILHDAPSGTFHAELGFVLVTSATAGRIEGAIVLQRAWRPLAPMPVPMAEAALPGISFRITTGR